MKDIIAELNDFEDDLETELLLNRLEEFLKKVHEFRTKYNITSFFYLEDDGSYFAVPSIEEMRECILRLIDNIKKEAVEWSSSWGFTVIKNADGKINFYYGISTY